MIPPRFGCCSDGETPAPGPEGEGCDEARHNCTLGPFGCCPDGKTWSQGPLDQGCFKCPEEVGKRISITLGTTYFGVSYLS